MNIATALSWATKYLHKKTPSAALDAEALLAMAIQKPKEYLLTRPEKTLTKKQQKKFRAAILRRAHGWPVAYLTGHQEFYGLDFLVTPAVLIPRPETELLVDICRHFVISNPARRDEKSLSSAKLTDRDSSPTARNDDLNIADIGTGSGCIAITLAKQLPQATVWATDISRAALTVTKKNAKKHQTKIRFLRGNLLLPLIKTKHWVKRGQTWFITANLPYLTKKQLTEPSIKKEPPLALYGGPDGLAYYHRLLRQLRRHAVNGNHYLLFLEIDPRQKNPLTKIVQKLFPKTRIEIKNDLAGQSRLLMTNFIA